MRTSDEASDGGVRDGGIATPPAPQGMLFVPGGAFTMGADRGGQDDEHPAHGVVVPAFWLDRTEVTNAAYAACVALTACGANETHLASREHRQNDNDFLRAEQPVTGVTWGNAREYCAAQGKRLPREAEFEKAVRDDDGRTFPWGSASPTPERAAFGRVLGKGAPDDVGLHPLGRGPYGHDDLAGNVWEWMEDEYDPLAYVRASARDGIAANCDEIRATQDRLRAEGKQGFTGSNPIPTECERVLRGGAFNYDGPGLRSTNRVHHPAHYRLLMAGFRCAKDASLP